MGMYREKMYEMFEDGFVDPDTLVTACLKFMSEDDIKEMMWMNEFYLDDEDEEIE